MIALLLAAAGLAFASPAPIAAPGGALTPAQFHAVVSAHAGAFVGRPPLDGLRALEGIAAAEGLPADRAAADAVLSLIAHPGLPALKETPAVRERLAATLGPNNLALVEAAASQLRAAAPREPGLRRALAEIEARLAPAEPGREADFSALEARLKSFFEGSVRGVDEPAAAPPGAGAPAAPPARRRGLGLRRFKPVPYRPRGAIDLAALDTRPPEGFGPKSRKEARKLLAKNQARLDALQERLYAGKKRALLVVFQAMDTGGKDGTIRRVLSGLNPQGVQVASFKVPTPVEALHDYLWRVHAAVPARGMIAVFNRSHYEDPLVAAVKGLLPRKDVLRMLREIPAFERYLDDNGVTVVKFFLNISKGEQKKRFQRRLELPEKHWKFSTEDLKTRELWPEFIAAYGETLARTSTPWAPWFVIPADKKWFRDWLVSEILVRVLEKIDPRFPPPSFDPAKIELED